jgi:hypothetical protein
MSCGHVTDVRRCVRVPAGCLVDGSFAGSKLDLFPQPFCNCLEILKASLFSLDLLESVITFAARCRENVRLAPGGKTPVKEKSEYNFKEKP